MGRTVYFDFAERYADALAAEPERVEFTITRSDLQRIVDSELALKREYPRPVPLEHQLDDLRRKYPAASIGEERDQFGQRLLSVPGVILPKGWAPTSTTIFILVPDGFPASQPERFYTPEDVRLAHGGCPRNTARGGTGFTGGPLTNGLLWWHWRIDRPSYRHTLVQYINAMRQRFAEVG
jgi:hypothetical protein